MMLRFLTSCLAVTFMVSLAGCQRDQPAPAKPGENPSALKPFLVKSNAGIDHEFYRDISLDEFLKMLPAGSVDSVNLDFREDPQVFAIVKVPDQPGKDLTKIRFATTFKTQDGQSIDKSWTAAKDRKSGKAAAVFCLPLSVVDGETRLISTE
jgi:hypothetical protein